MGLSIYDATSQSIKLNDSFTVTYKFNSTDTKSTELYSCVGFTIPQPKYQEMVYTYGNKQRKFLVPDYEAPDDLQLELLETDTLQTSKFVANLLNRLFDFKRDSWVYKEQNIYEIRIDILDNNFSKIVYSYVFRHLKLTNYESYGLDYASADAPGQWNLSFAYMHFVQGPAGDIENGVSKSEAEQAKEQEAASKAENDAENKELHDAFDDEPTEPPITETPEEIPEQQVPGEEETANPQDAANAPKSQEDIDELAYQMYKGNLGNGKDRIANAKAAGFSDEEIAAAQAIVNQKDWSGLENRHNDRMSGEEHKPGELYPIEPPDITKGNPAYQEALSENSFAVDLAVAEGNAAVITDQWKEESLQEDLHSFGENDGFISPENAAILAELEDLDLDDEAAPEQPAAPTPAEANDHDGAVLYGTNEAPKTKEDIEKLADDIEKGLLDDTHADHMLYAGNRGFNEDEVKQAEAIVDARKNAAKCEESSSSSGSVEDRGEELAEKVHKGKISSKGGWVKNAKAEGYTDEEIEYAKAKFNSNKEYAAEWKHYKAATAEQKAQEEFDAADAEHKQAKQELDDVRARGGSSEEEDAAFDKAYDAWSKSLKAEEKLGKAKDDHGQADAERDIVRGTDPMTFGSKKCPPPAEEPKPESPSEPEFDTKKLIDDSNSVYKSSAPTTKPADKPEEKKADPPSEPPVKEQPPKAPTFGANSTTKPKYATKIDDKPTSFAIDEKTAVEYAQILKNECAHLVTNGSDDNFFIVEGKNWDAYKRGEKVAVIDNPATVNDYRYAQATGKLK